MSDTLFEGIRPMTDDEQARVEPPEPVEIEDLANIPKGPWERTQDMSTDLAVEWLLRPPAQLGLIAFALEELQAGDAMFRNKSELAQVAGTHRATLHRHIDGLVRLGIYEERTGVSYDKYRANVDSDILQALAHVEYEIRQRV